MIHATAPNAKTTNPQRVPVITKITFLPHRAKRGLNVFLNATLRCNFSGGPPVKTGGFPRPYGGRGGAGCARSEKIALRANVRLQSGKRPTGATIHQPRGSAKRDQTSERWLSNATRFGCLGVGRFAEFPNRAGARNGIQRPNLGYQTRRDLVVWAVGASRNAERSLVRRLKPDGLPRTNVRGALRAVKFSRLASLRLAGN